MLLEVEDLVVRYRTARGLLTAVDGVSLALERGQTLGLVGESGCGKSSLGKAVARLIPAQSGTIRLDGEDIAQLDRSALKRYRPRLQMMFQDALAAFDPRRTVGSALAQPLEVHRMGDRHERHRKVVQRLYQVGLPESVLDRLPHEFSGGQRQRISLARTLMLDPDVVVCDEPVAALDVSLQAQVLNLMTDLQRELGLSYVFISHDLSVIGHVADRIAVMYLGTIVEVLPRQQLWEGSLHPYTRLLIASVPEIGGRAVSFDSAARAGELPSPFAPPSGCRFRTRCPHAEQTCAEAVPPLRDTGDGHWVACHLYPAKPATTKSEQPEPEGVLS